MLQIRSRVASPGTVALVVQELKAWLAETTVISELRLAVELLETGRRVQGVAALARVDTLTIKLRSAQ